MEELIKEWSYWGVAFFLWGTGFGVPLPEDICLLAAGWLCGQDIAELWIMLPLTLFCVLGSDCLIYFLGWKFGRRVTRIWPFRKILNEHKLAKAEALFHTHGGKTLFAARFMPLVRAPSFFTAGTFQYSFLKFLFYDGMAALLSVPALVLAGYFFADQFQRVKQVAREVQILIAIGVALLVVTYIGYHLWRRKREKAELASVADARGNDVQGNDVQGNDVQGNDVQGNKNDSDDGRETTEQV